MWSISKLRKSRGEKLFAAMFEGVGLNIDGFASQADGTVVVRLEEDAEGIES